jgi:hypothetical protein
MVLSLPYFDGFDYQPYFYIRKNPVINGCETDYTLVVDHEIRESWS